MSNGSRIVHVVDALGDADVVGRRNQVRHAGCTDAEYFRSDPVRR
jgi:hypothetical protein